MRKLLVIAVGVLVVGGVVLAATVAPRSATAQTRPSQHVGGLRSYCIGTRLESHTIRNRHGVAVGHTELWYSPIKGGENCVMTYNKRGRPWTAAYIYRLTRKGGTADEEAEDASNYEYYAGGSYVDHANGRCVVWGGLVNDAGWNSRRNGVHCG